MFSSMHHLAEHAGQVPLLWQRDIPDLISYLKVWFVIGAHQQYTRLGMVSLAVIQPPSSKLNYVLAMFISN